jgi:hypothetical protein
MCLRSLQCNSDHWSSTFQAAKSTHDDDHILPKQQQHDRQRKLFSRLSPNASSTRSATSPVVAISRNSSIVLELVGREFGVECCVGAHEVHIGAQYLLF